MVRKKSGSGSKTSHKQKKTKRIQTKSIPEPVDISNKTDEPEIVTESLSPLEFQIIDWNSYHEVDALNEEQYVIQLFGRTEDDKDVCLKVVGFTPFFYISIPQNWDEDRLETLIDSLKETIHYKTEKDPKYGYDLRKGLKAYRIVKKHKFDGFTGEKLFKFAQLVFKSHTVMREFSNILSREVKLKNAYDNRTEYMFFQRYESNIEPHIRFMHMKNLSSCGWLRLDKSKMVAMKNYSHCDYSYKIRWTDVTPILNDNRMAPLKIMSYDIECVSSDYNFPQAKRPGDKIIQIGMTVYRYGSMLCSEQHILTLKKCAKIKDVNVESFRTERAMLLAFAKKISTIRPDFRTGYNIFDFDDSYIYKRIKYLDKRTAQKQKVDVEDLDNSFMTQFLTAMGKLNNQYIIKTENLDTSLTHFVKKPLSSSALGDNFLKFFQTPGTLTFDTMKIIQRDNRLDGYRLDNVSAHFIKEKVIGISSKKIEDNDNTVEIYTTSTRALEHDAYIQIMINDGYSSSPLRENVKYKVRNITSVKKELGGKETDCQCITIKLNDQDLQELESSLDNKLLQIYWTFAKDDMHHTKLFRYYSDGTPRKIRTIAKYCLKDCKLVNLLVAKLETIVNNLGMAQVCHVPLSYLFLRGQGVKIFSLVSKTCREKNYLIPVLTHKNRDATSDDTDESYEGAAVINPKPNVYEDPIAVLDFNSLYPNAQRERNLTHECYISDPKYDNLPGYKYHDIEFPKKDKKGRILRDMGGMPIMEHNRFAQKLDENGNPVYGILPAILTELLDARKATNAKLGVEKDPFVKTILNSLQLAYKVTANSLYGQTGAPTSPIYFMRIASSTTAIGRERLFGARKLVHEQFKGSEIIYGDTDSIFINFHLTDEKGNRLTGKPALIKTIELAQKAADLINANIPNPQRIVYEKTYHPFILVSKKKYVGLKFEKDPEKYTVSAMGMVLKRRDNAPIVKVVVGGIINHILKNGDHKAAIEHTKTVLENVMKGGYTMDKFMISKNLKAKYKDPKSIAHKVLADRMGKRDPGNKPTPGDRIPFVYAITNVDRRKKVLQGDLIEHPDYVVQNNLEIDYLHYLTNQIMKPTAQILKLTMTKKAVEKIFNKFITAEHNRRNHCQSMAKWMKKPEILDEEVDVQSTKRKFISGGKEIEPIFIGTTKRIECQNMSKWIEVPKTVPKTKDVNKNTTNEVGVRSTKRSAESDPIYAKKRAKLPSRSMDTFAVLRVNKSAEEAVDDPGDDDDDNNKSRE